MQKGKLKLGLLKEWMLKLAIVFILAQFTCQEASAQFIYNDCVTAADFGQVGQDRFVIRPIGEICYQRCASECKAFSQLSGGMELNQDIIDECNVHCRSGKVFRKAKRVPNPDTSSTTPYIWSNAESATGTFCAVGDSAIDSAGNNIYNTKIRVKPKSMMKKPEEPAPGSVLIIGAKSSTAVDNSYIPEQLPGVRIKIIYPSTDSSNVIYMCGSTNKAFEPRPAYMKKADWDNRPSEWKPSKSTSWNARNDVYTDTGIDMKDGDFISITYGGQYRSCNTANCPPTDLDKGLFIMRPNSRTGAQKVSVGNSFVMPAARVQTVDMDIKDGVPQYKKDPGPVLESNAAIKFLGLSVRTWNQNTRFGAGINFDGKNLVFNGNTFVSDKDSYYMFSGILQGFSRNFARLAIAHPDDKNTWSNHYGGYYVNVVRKGCQFTNGQRLQYAIGAIDPNSSTTNPTFSAPTVWYDLTDSNLVDYEDIKIPVEGLLYLRIKPLEYESAATPSCQSKDPACALSILHTKGLYKPENTDGQYYVLVEQDDTSSATNVISKIINTIRGYLFGIGEDKEGVVQYLFNKFVADSELISIVRALMFLYITYTGLSFVLGIAQFTQKEALSRLIKIGIVLTLIAPGSWKFFNDYLFKLFTDGALELLIKFTASPEASPSQINDLLKNPTQIFSVFNEPFKILFGKVTWIKVGSLFFSGAIGIIIMLVIILSAVIYAICIAKATLLYMISIVGIAVLMLMAPIFISFVLFQFTKQMFDNWLKQLMSFVFQPIFVYVFIVVINYLILASLKVVLGFTACRACWFSLVIPGVDSTCLIPGYVSLYGLHNPESGMGMPMSSIAAAFYFLVLAQAMYAFTSFGARLANTIVMGSFVGLDLTNIAQNLVNETRGMTTALLGVDMKSVEAGERVSRKAKWLRDTIGGKDKDKEKER
jgi:type IV secretion system protein VirB6